MDSRNSKKDSVPGEQQASEKVAKRELREKVAKRELIGTR